MILQLSDFESGLTQISTNEYTSANLLSYLTEENEKKYIYQIFGKTLGDEFLADLSGTPSVPNTAKWQLVFSQFDYEVNDYGINCIGIKEILKYLLYRDYVSQQPIKNTITGNSSVRGEASDPNGMVKKVTVIYNRAAEEIDTLQHYIVLNSTDYPNFRGQIFEYQTGL